MAHIKNVNKAEKLIDNLKDNGYRLDVLINNCKKEVIWKSVNASYENDLKK